MASSCLFLVRTFLLLIFLTVAKPVFAQSLQPLIGNSIRQHIVLDGNLATQHSQTRKFTVRLEMLDSNEVVKSYCTGILLHQDIVLTAGHCFHPGIAAVRVKFGLGLQKGFTDSIVSREFRWAYVHPEPKGSGSSRWVDGRMTFNEKSRDAYEAELKERLEMKNYVNDPSVAERDFYDYAVIHIKQIPKGYKPIRIYNDEVHFRMPVYAAGYGANSVIKDKNDDALRWSTFELVGHFTHEGSIVRGWQIYSPTRQQVCFGDSGGPLVVKVANEYQLLGINLFTYNNCHNSNWYLNLHDSLAQINAFIQELRAE